MKTTARDEHGSALVITLMLLVILTAIGIYALSISTTEMNIALQSRVGTATLNSADSGANFGIDRVPDILFAPGYTGVLPDNSSYTVTSWATGVLIIRPGFGANFRFADFEVVSVGQSPPQFAARRGVDVVANYGPVPVGTMY
jgi:hypothetical protein